MPKKKKRVEKRTVTTDALETLGEIHTRAEKRDAIHLAVDPVTAGERLLPGQHIKVKNGIAESSPIGGGMGIVDPFLPRPVQSGERFWFVMYPRMVRSLRHVWTHPDFPDEPLPVPVPIDPAAVAEAARVEALDRAERALGGDVEYLTNYATELNMTYDEFMRVADEWIDTGYGYTGGSEAEGINFDSAKFWKCWERVTGREVPDERRHNFIGCSC